MIAPLRESNTAIPDQSRLSEAHEFLAATLLESPAEKNVPAVAPWKAWALIGWMVLVVAYYGGSMLGWW